MCAAKTVGPIVAVLAMTVCLCTYAAGQDTKTSSSIEIARLKLRLFERVEYPLRLRELSDDIKLAQAEIESLKRQEKELERFKTKAFFASLENLRLRRLEAELRLKKLRHERVLLQIYAKDEVRLRRLTIERESQLLYGE